MERSNFEKVKLWKGLTLKRSNFEKVKLWKGLTLERFNLGMVKLWKDQTFKLTNLSIHKQSPFRIFLLYQSFCLRPKFFLTFRKLPIYVGKNEGENAELSHLKIIFSVNLRNEVIQTISQAINTHAII